MTHSARALEAQLGRVRALESLLTFQMAVVSRRLDQQASALLQDTGLNLTAYRILTVTDVFEAISVSDLSRYNAIDRAQVSRTAADLERRGLVSFLSDPGSRRKKLVALTDAGVALLETVRPRFMQRNRDLEAALGPEALEGLRQGLEALAGTVRR